MVRYVRKADIPVFEHTNIAKGLLAISCVNRCSIGHAVREKGFYYPPFC